MNLGHHSAQGVATSCGAPFPWNQALSITIGSSFFFRKRTCTGNLFWTAPNQALETWYAEFVAQRQLQTRARQASRGLWICCLNVFIIGCARASALTVVVGVRAHTS